MSTSPSSLSLPTRKARRFINVPAALVRGDLWIRAQRTRPIRRAVLYSRRGDLLRRLALLHPRVERGQHVERAGAITAAAMAHARHHEEARGVAHVLDL